MPDTFNEQLGRRIREARTGKLTQGKLGELVGLSRTAITNIECGRQRLLVDQLVEIAGAIGVTTESLLPTKAGRKKSPEPTTSKMPTVDQWLSSVKKSAQGGRT